MKKSILIILPLIFLALTSFKEGRKHPSSNLPFTGFLDITVESNVNKVQFSYPITADNMQESSNPEENQNVTDIVVPVKDFRCNNRVAYKDFITLLKADEFPDLVISLPQAALNKLRSEKNFILHNVLISIAGVTREYDIVCKTEGPDNIPAGTITVGLRDLDIKPPVKYFGMVKVKDEVIVKFGLGIQDQSFARK